jgi:hypothetical protein
MAVDDAMVNVATKRRPRIIGRRENARVEHGERHSKKK